MNYYNEIEKFPAQWLRNLSDAGHISRGHVDERSIADVTPEDLRGFKQCHFFAGIGVWSYALRLAGWEDDREVWTGSCPCQPFSAAGKRGGTSDARHLWPEWFRLIRECRPKVIFGEQVASAVVTGGSGNCARKRQGIPSEIQIERARERLNKACQEEVDEEEYLLRPGRACGGDTRENRQGRMRSDGVSIQLALGKDVGQPVIGQDRLKEGLSIQQYEGRLLRDKCGDGGLGGTEIYRPRVNDSEEATREVKRFIKSIGDDAKGENGQTWFDAVSNDLEGIGYTVRACIAPACGFGAPHIRQRLYFVAESGRIGRGGGSERPDERKVQERGCAKIQVEGSDTTRIVADTTGGRLIERESEREQAGHVGEEGEPRIVADTGDNGSQGLRGQFGQQHNEEGWKNSERHGGETGSTNGFWSDAVWLPCRDGKARATKPGIFPLAHGTTSRVGRLRAYGNAIVAPVAAEFVRAYLDILD